MKIVLGLGYFKFSVDMKVVLKDKRKALFTRYFSFSRIDPQEKDYGVLIETCADIDAYLGYRTARSNGVDRLEGFMVLNGPRAYACDLCRLFPNFLVNPLKEEVYIKMMGHNDFIFKGYNTFESIRKKLFTGDAIPGLPVRKTTPESLVGFSKRIFDKEEDNTAVAVATAYPVQVEVEKEAGRINPVGMKIDEGRGTETEV